jgi:hypothetical protein
MSTFSLLIAPPFLTERLHRQRPGLRINQSSAIRSLSLCLAYRASRSLRPFGAQTARGAIAAKDQLVSPAG